MLIGALGEASPVLLPRKDPASRALVGPALIAEHLAGRIPAWSLAGQDLLAWQQGTLTDPSRVEALLAALIRPLTYRSSRNPFS
jgi:hypothetical protein